MSSLQLVKSNKKPRARAPLWQRARYRHPTLRELMSVPQRIPRYLKQSSPFPPYQINTLEFTAEDNIQDATNSWTYIDGTFWNAFNPFPSILTAGSTLGYQTLIRAYAINLVLSIRFRITFISNEPAHGVTGFVAFSDTQPAPASLLALKRLGARTPSTPKMTVGQTTGMSRITSPWVVVEAAPHVIGSVYQYIGDQGFYGTPGASPTQLLYAIIGAYNTIGTPLTNGINFVIEVQQTVFWGSLLNDY